MLKHIRPVSLLLVLTLITATGFAAKPEDEASKSADAAAARGQSVTLLPDGRILLLGGRGKESAPTDTAFMRDPISGAEAQLPASLAIPRQGHTATVLPDGSVLILGGVNAAGQVVSQAEIFNPETLSFSMAQSQPPPRAFHTATLITDGRLVIAGGIGPNGASLSIIEIWDPRGRNSLPVAGKLAKPRRGHNASLLADGRVLFSEPQKQKNVEIFDPVALTVTRGNVAVDTQRTPEVVASSPQDGAIEVPLDAVLSVRFAAPVRMGSISTSTVTLKGPEGELESRTVAAEAGMLGFITPRQPLVPGTTYAVTLAGVAAHDGSTVPFWVFTFTTEGTNPEDAANAAAAAADNGNAGAATSADALERLRKLPPLMAPPGVTAVSGQVITIHGEPLAHVTLEMNGKKTHSDATGRFLIAGTSTGRQVLEIDGSTAQGARGVYGFFENGIEIKGGKTNVLEYTIWMTPLDLAHAVRIPSPTKAAMVVTNPNLPGLELHLPAGTVIYDRKGKVVTQLTMTPIPVDKPPFPLPLGVSIPTYYTIQPGGAYVKAPNYQGARLIYPNWGNLVPGSRLDFWDYDPEVRDWYVYAKGTVTQDAKQAVPDPGYGIHEFTGAMMGSTPYPSDACKVSSGPNDCSDTEGDPIDPSTGLFIYSKTDLYVADVIPLAVTRTYRQSDGSVRAFGIGTNDDYDMFLTSVNNYQEVDLILPGGGKVHYVRISPGTGFVDAVYQHTGTPSKFNYSTIFYNGCGWNLKLKDGFIYRFADPAYGVIGMKDRYGNAVQVLRTSNIGCGPNTVGPITKLVSPNGRWIEFTSDGSGRITSAKDNIGRTVTYHYDSLGRLDQVTDVAGGITKYTYDIKNQMLTITDPRGITYLTNEYDINGRVIKQTQADNTSYQFAYTTGPNGKVTQTDVTDPRGFVRRITFAASGYVASKTVALGQTEEQTITFNRDPATNLLSSVVDALSRQVAYTYDVKGNLATLTWLAGTAGATTTQFTYDPNFNQVATVTDALNHITQLGYDPNGKLVSVSDPLQHQSTFAYNPDGTLASVTNALNKTTQFGYERGLLTSTTDPLLQTTTFGYDGAGRLVSAVDALGRTTTYAYNALNQLTQMKDPLQGITSFTYDTNGNLLSVQDAQQQGTSAKTSYTYDSMDRVVTRTDPLLRQESYRYDAAGNVKTAIDRRGKIATYSYDPLNRVNFAGFGTALGTPNTYESSTNYSYDSANRLTQAVDTASGTVVRTYNDQTRTFSEGTPQGTVTSVFDAAGRRTSMTVAGQAAVSYTYDNANRLTQISQGIASTTIGYDAANRRTSLTLPNNVVVTYGYDNASRLTSLLYEAGITNLGDLTYSYDAAGRRTKVDGSFGRSGIPQPLTFAMYDVAHQLTNWDGVELTYDANGNLTNDGTRNYTWDARNQLSSLGTTNLAYDFAGRRTQLPSGNLALYDGADAVQELSGTTPVANRVLGGIDELFTRTDASGMFIPLVDALGSTIALVDSSGVVQTQYTYDPFGNTTVLGTASANLFQYTGRESDDNELYYYRARYYSPLLGRFISEDPLGLGGGDPNFYAYVFNSPTNFNDPFGLSAGILPPPVAAGAAGVGAGTALGAGFGAEVATGSIGGPAGVAVLGAAALGWGIGRGIGHIPIGHGQTIDDGVQLLFEPLFSPSPEPRPTPLAGRKYPKKWPWEDDYCDVLYEIDVQRCRARGAGKECYEEAMRRYAQCRHDKGLD